MHSAEIVSILKSIIEREQEDGCIMAHESLIEPALRRLNSYERRNRRNKTITFANRVLDLKKGLRTLFADQIYDDTCLTHLAESFVTAFDQESDKKVDHSHHETT